MKKINTKQGIKNFKNEDLKNPDGSIFTVGEAIASTLLEDGATGTRIKLFVLSQKFWSEEEVELDEADFKMVKENVERSKSIGTIVAGQLLVMLEKIEEVKKDK